jgi:hypothetical protein
MDRFILIYHHCCIYTYFIFIFIFTGLIYRSLVGAFSPYSRNRCTDFNGETVSNYVVKSSKGRLGDDDDAREFLNDTLNQVRKEFLVRDVDHPSPISRLFECDIDNKLICMDCGNEVIQTEHYQDFCLEIPACDTNRSR